MDETAAASARSIRVSTRVVARRGSAIEREEKTKVGEWCAMKDPVKPARSGEVIQNQRLGSLVLCF